MSVVRGREWQGLMAACAVLAVPSIWAPAAPAAVAGYLAGLALVASGLVAGLRRMTAPERATWRWIAYGTLSGVAGSVLWLLPIPLPPVRGVGVQDLCWLSVYPLVLRGVVLRIRSQGLGAGVRRAVLLDTVVVTGAATVVTWHLLIEPAVALFAPAGPFVAVVAMAYPLGDVVMFALGAALLFTRGRREVSETLLVAALAMELPMDLVHGLVLAHAPGAGDGWYRAGYLVINAMIGAAGLRAHATVSRPAGDARDSVVHGWRMLMLGGGLTGILLGTVFMPESGWGRVPVAVAVVAALVAILLRFHRAVRALESAERRMHHQATHDQLTGAANRARLLTELSATVRESVPTLVFVDLDGFKLVNDSLGHQAGDDVLLAVVQRVAAVVRSGDLVARIGGDEFVVVCRSVDQAAAEALARRIDHAIRQPVTVGDQQVSVGASIGILVGEPCAVGQPEAEAVVAELLRLADAAMYDAKRSGAGLRVVHHAVAA